MYFETVESEKHWVKQKFHVVGSLWNELSDWLAWTKIRVHEKEHVWESGAEVASISVLMTR